MRINTLSEHGPAGSLVRADAEVRDAYLGKMTGLADKTSTKVMLADMTVMDQTTFDVDRIKTYMNAVIARLDADWSALQEVSETKAEDVRRIFVRLKSEAFGYVLSVHLSVQFRALLYYKPDARVTGIQKDLAGIEEVARSDGVKIADVGDRLVAERLRRMGYVEPDHAKLFEILYRDELLVSSMTDEVRRAAGDAGMIGSADKQEALLAELNSLLIETYDTTPVMIDDTRLVTGEGGFLYAADIEKTVTDAAGAPAKEGVFDINGMPDAAICEVASRLRQLRDAIVQPT